MSNENSAGETRRKHALLSPSGAYKWLNCAPSARLEETLPDSASEYAAEGTLAHDICELYANARFKGVKKAAVTKALKPIKANPLYDAEMLRHAEGYVDRLSELYMQFEAPPYIAFEVRVDLTAYVPEAFGTCDAIMIGSGALIVTDFKYGKGVPVSAEANPQLMLYALGALNQYRPLYGAGIEVVRIFVDQPRLSNYDSFAITVNDLLDWGENVVKPKAQAAFAGIGEYAAGDWCDKGFCRARSTCRKRSEHYGAVADFAGLNTPNKGKEPVLTHAQIGEVLERFGGFVKWFEGVKEYALSALLNGEDIPGWKAVEGRSSRAWSDANAALAAIEAAGVDRAIIYDYVPKTLAQLEKAIGAKQFGEIAAKYITKPPGKPTLAPESDDRPDIGRNQKSEVRSQMSDVRGQMSDFDDLAVTITNGPGGS